MKLPVPPEYLAKALMKECALGDITLRHRPIAQLKITTGNLVACDPLIFFKPETFQERFPCRTVPVILSVAHFSNEDQRVAFATLLFEDTDPVDWKMLAAEGQKFSDLAEGDAFGYAVDLGTGCFMDERTARLLEEEKKEHGFFRSIGALWQKLASGSPKSASKPDSFKNLEQGLKRSYVDTWAWAEAPIADGNVVAFSSGFGDGLYATYAGYAASGKICAVVTDFAVVPFEDESEL